MANPIDRFLLLLAGSNLGRSDCLMLFEWLRSHPPSEIYNSIEELRYLARSPGRSLPLNVESTSRHSADKDFASRMERLVMEYKIPRAVAASYISHALRSRVRSLPDWKKISFREWIRRLLSRVSEEEILETLIKLRNQTAHGEKMDWPLRRDVE